MSVKLFKTSVLGVGPFCLEFEDGEIIHTRSEDRQKLIARAIELLPELDAHAARIEAQNQRIAVLEKAIGNIDKTLRERIRVNP
jgi:hypothetical protein